MSTPRSRPGGRRRTSSITALKDIPYVISYHSHLVVKLRAHSPRRPPSVYFEQESAPPLASRPSLIRLGAVSIVSSSSARRSHGWLEGTCISTSTAFGLMSFDSVSPLRMICVADLPRHPSPSTIHPLPSTQPFSDRFDYRLGRCASGGQSPQLLPRLLAPLHPPRPNRPL
jgi:hypothetical protein